MTRAIRAAIVALGVLSACGGGGRARPAAQAPRTGPRAARDPVNPKAAKAFRLAVPAAVLARVNGVIDVHCMNRFGVKSGKALSEQNIC